jgi:hypothetical protein
MRSGRIAVLAVGVLAAGAVAVPALAGQTVKSKITMDHNVNAFKGHIESSKHACEVDRRVKLFKGEGFHDYPHQLAGTDRSNGHGVWKIRVNPGARYYARVVRSKEDTAGTTFVCGGDRTKVIDLH